LANLWACGTDRLAGNREVLLHHFFLPLLGKNHHLLGRVAMAILAGIHFFLRTLCIHETGWSFSACHTGVAEWSGPKSMEHWGKILVITGMSQKEHYVIHLVAFRGFATL